MSKTPKPTSPGYTQADWDEVSDSPELTAGDLKRARSAAEIYPDLAAASARRRGRPKSAASKIAVKIRVSPDILAAYKAAGDGWQTRMNDALRKGAPGLVRTAPKSRAKELAAAALREGTKSSSSKKSVAATTSTTSSSKSRSESVSRPGSKSSQGTRSASSRSNKRRPNRA